VAAIADASGRAADVGEGAAMLMRRRWYSVRFMALVSRPMRGVGAAGEGALTAHHRVVGTGPFQSQNDPVLALKHEKVCRERCPTAGRAGQARGPED
jgi:hypothetical protein